MHLALTVTVHPQSPQLQRVEALPQLSTISSWQTLRHHLRSLASTKQTWASSNLHLPQDTHPFLEATTRPKTSYSALEHVPNFLMGEAAAANLSIKINNFQILQWTWWWDKWMEVCHLNSSIRLFIPYEMIIISRFSSNLIMETHIVEASLKVPVDLSHF